MAQPQMSDKARIKKTFVVKALKLERDVEQIPEEEENAMTMMSNSNSGGLMIANNKTLRNFLGSSAKDPNLNQELRRIASNLSSEPSVPYISIKNLWFALPPSTRPKLLHLFSGSDFVFSSPKPREKSEELKARLKKLQELAERNDYKELVKDITPGRDAPQPFSSYKDQLGFGLHVVLTMFTGYLVGYAAFRALFNHSPVMNAAGGILGLVCGMLLETLIFMIKFSKQDLASSSPVSTMKKRQ